MFPVRPILRAFLSLALFLGHGCAEVAAKEALGSLSLDLQSQAAGISYRLTDANFSLVGPENKLFSSEDEAQVRLDVPSGAYTLELLPGYRLVRVDAPETPVEARLVSANPSPLWVDPGAVTQVALRFSLSDGTHLSNEPGTLAVGLELTAPGEHWVGDPCIDGLKINELDYDQPGTDTAEFVEILNTESCDAILDGLLLEFVNGPDAKVYARYALGTAGSALKSQGRLVVGSAAILASLPEDVLRVPLKAAGIQNGPDGVRLVAPDGVLDALAYEGPVAGSGEGAFASADTGDFSLSRCPDGLDTDDNARDFQLKPPTPGLPNACE